MKDYNVLNALVPKTQELHRAIFDKGYEQGFKDSLIYDTIPKFIDQLKIKDIDKQYSAGMVCSGFIIGYATNGAEKTFSIGQPVYDKDKNIMGWLGIGLFDNLDYSTEIRVPCEYWKICLPTEFCKVGKQVYTYWQMAEVESQESEG